MAASRPFVVLALAGCLGALGLPAAGVRADEPGERSTARFVKPLRSATDETAVSALNAPQAGESTTRLTTTTARVTRDTVDSRLRWVAPSRNRSRAATSGSAAADSHAAELAGDRRPSAVRTVVADEGDAASPVRHAHRAADQDVADDPFADPFQDGPALSSGSGNVRRTMARIVDPGTGDEVELVEPQLTRLQATPDDDLPEALREDTGEPAPMPAPDTSPIEDTIPRGDDDRRSLEEEVAQGPAPDFGPCPSPKELKRIGEITDDITPEGTEFPQECGLGDELYQPRSWALTTYHWKASSLCHKPLYFQQVAVERYGHTWPLIQPLVSAANFYLTFPVLPYKMGLNPPWECLYPLGYYRPGSCAPYMVGAVPISVRAGLLEAGAWVGGVYLIP